MTINRLTTLVFIILFTISCSTTPQNTSPVPDNIEAQKKGSNTAKSPEPKEKEKQHVLHLSSEERADLYYSILLASIADARSVYDVARDNYIKAAQVTGHPIYARNAVLASERMRDFESSLLAAELWRANNPEDVKAVEVTTIGYLRKNNEKEALKHLSTLIESLPIHDNEKNYHELMRIVRTVKSSATLNVLKQAAQQYPSHAYLSLLVSQMALYYQDLPLAQASAKEALRVDPLFTTAIKQQAHLLFKSGQIEQAEALLESKLKAQPKNRDLLIGFSRLLYDLKEYKKAIKHLETIINLNHSDLEARYLLAICFHSANQLDNSLTQFLLLIRYNYQPDISWFYIGDIHEQQNKAEQAIAAYHSVRRGAYKISAGLRLSHLYSQRGEVDDALKLLQSLAADHPDFERDVYLTEVEILNEFQSESASIARIDALIQQYPNALQYVYKKIGIYLTNKKADAAWQTTFSHHNLLSEADEQERFLLTAAAYFRQLGFPQKALDVLDEGLKHSPTSKELLYSRALYSESVKDYDSVILYLRKLLQLDPDNMDAMNALGYTLVDLNRELAEAEKLIRTAYDAMPNNPAVIDSMGWLHYRKAEYAQAIIYLKRAVKLEKSGEIVAHLADAMRKAGQKSEAINTLKEFLSIYPEDEQVQSKLKEIEQIP